MISLELADPDPAVLGQRGELQPALEHLVVPGPGELGPGVRPQAAACLPHPLAGPLPLAVTGLVDPSKMENEAKIVALQELFWSCYKLVLKGLVETKGLCMFFFLF